MVAGSSIRLNENSSSETAEDPFKHNLKTFEAAARTLQSNDKNVTNSFEMFRHVSRPVRLSSNDLDRCATPDCRDCPRFGQCRQCHFVSRSVPNLDPSLVTRSSLNDVSSSPSSPPFFPFPTACQSDLERYPSSPPQPAVGRSYSEGADALKHHAGRLQQPAVLNCFNLYPATLRQESNKMRVRVMEAMEPCWSVDSLDSFNCKPRRVKKLIASQPTCSACPYCDDICDDSSCRKCLQTKHRVCRKFQQENGSSKPSRFSDQSLARLSRHQLARIRNPRNFTPCEVLRHQSPTDCWIMAHGIVYDATTFLPRHPAGPECIMRKSGLDTTVDFDFHTCESQQLWSRYQIGYVIPCKGYPGSEKLSYKSMFSILKTIVSPCGIS